MQLPKTVPWWTRFILGTTYTVPAPTKGKEVPGRKDAGEKQPQRQAQAAA